MNDSTPPLVAPEAAAPQAPNIGKSLVFRPKSVADIFNQEFAALGRLREVATRYLPAERAFRLASSALRKTPKLLQCDPGTFFGALQSATALGLEPNTPQGLAYLIPYARRAKVNNQWTEIIECQFQIGYKGFISLMYRNPIVLDIQADWIGSNDKCEIIQGSESHLKLWPNLRDGRGDVIGAFCMTTIQRGVGVYGKPFTYLDRHDLEKIRSRSEAFRSLTQLVESGEKWAQKKLDETPWVFWDDQMAKKSAIKRHAKTIDLGSELSAAATIDDGRTEMRLMVDPDMVKGVMSGEIDAPQMDDAETVERPAIAKPDDKPVNMTQAKQAEPEKQPVQAVQAEPQGAGGAGDAGQATEKRGRGRPRKVAAEPDNGPREIDEREEPEPAKPAAPAVKKPAADAGDVF